MHKLESIMQWQARNKWQKTERYGFKSSRTPTQVKDHIPFENELIALVQSTRFRKTRNHYQKKLQKDIQLVKSSNTPVTSIDETTNLYRLTKAEYDHMTITSKFKKASCNIEKEININRKRILKRKEVLN